MSCPAFGLIVSNGSAHEQHLDIAAQMVDARCRDARSALRFREDEGTLQDHLDVQCQASRRPIRADTVKLHRLGYVCFQRCSLAADRCIACLPYLGVGSIYLLHQRAGETGELRELSFEQPLAEVEIAEDPIQGIAVLVIERRPKKGRRELGPAIQRGHGELGLALEVMEECTLAHSCLRAELLDRGSRVPSLADERKRCFQQLLATSRSGALRMTLFSHPCTIPTGWYAVNGREGDFATWVFECMCLSTQ